MQYIVGSPRKLSLKEYWPAMFTHSSKSKRKPIRTVLYVIVVNIRLAQLVDKLVNKERKQSLISESIEIFFVTL